MTRPTTATTPTPTATAPQADRTAAGRSGLFVAAHPPGRGSGAAIHAATVAAGLGRALSELDVLALQRPGEDALADPGTLRIPIPAEVPPLPRIWSLTRGGAYYAPARRAGLESRFRELIDAGSLSRRYDLVWVHTPLPARAVLEAFEFGVSVLDDDNVVGGEVSRSAGAARGVLRAYRRFYAGRAAREESLICNRFDGVVVTSELERGRLRHVSVQTEIIPNSAPGGPLARPAESGPVLLYVGSLDYEPNIDAVSTLTRDVLPRVRARRADARLIVAGRRPVESVRRMCVEAAAELVEDPPDLDPLYAQTRAVVVPVRLGGGTRVKLVEAMGRRMAIVSSPQGVEGLELTDGENCLIGHSDEELAEQCLRLIEDPELAGRIADAGYKRWLRELRPEAVEQRVAALARRLLER